MDKLTSFAGGIFGGLITVAIIALLLNPRNKTSEVIKSTFSGFSDALRTAMGDTRY